MAGKTLPVTEHTLTLQRGATATLIFRHPPPGTPGDLSVRLVAAEPAGRRLSLSLDRMWGFHEMYKRAARPDGSYTWEPLRVGNDDRVLVDLDLAAGDQLYIGAEGASTHSLSLERVDWQGQALILTFAETP